MGEITSMWPGHTPPIVYSGHTSGAQRYNDIANLYNQGQAGYQACEECFGEFGGFEKNGVLYVPGKNGPEVVGISERGEKWFALPGQTVDGNAALVHRTQDGESASSCWRPTRRAMSAGSTSGLCQGVWLAQAKTSTRAQARSHGGVPTTRSAATATSTTTRGIETNAYHVPPHRVLVGPASVGCPDAFPAAAGADAWTIDASSRTRDYRVYRHRDSKPRRRRREGFAGPVRLEGLPQRQAVRRGTTFAERVPRTDPAHGRAASAARPLATDR